MKKTTYALQLMRFFGKDLLELNKNITYWVTKDYKNNMKDWF